MNFNTFYVRKVKKRSSPHERYSTNERQSESEELDEKFYAELFSTLSLLSLSLFPLSPVFETLLIAATRDLFRALKVEEEKNNKLQ